MRWGGRYAVPPADSNLMNSLAQSFFPEGFAQCDQLLRHKNHLISPKVLHANAIRCSRVVQRAGQFVLTFPGTYHSGFNCGYEH